MFFPFIPTTTVCLPISTLFMPIFVLGHRFTVLGPYQPTLINEKVADIFKRIQTSFLMTKFDPNRSTLLSKAWETLSGISISKFENELRRKIILSQDISSSEVVELMLRKRHQLPEDFQSDLAARLHKSEQSCEEFLKELTSISAKLNERGAELDQKKENFLLLQEEFNTATNALKEAYHSLPQDLDALIPLLKELLKQKHKAATTCQASLEELTEILAEKEKQSQKTTQISNESLAQFLICPYTHYSLTNAVALTTGQGMVIANAEFFGLKIEKGKCISISEATLSTTAKALLAQAIFIRPHFMMIDLVKAVEGSNWDLTKLPIDDIATLEPVENPIVLQCGHTMGLETAEKVHICPVCRSPIDEVEKREDKHIQAFVSHLKERTLASEILITMQAHLACFPLSLEGYRDSLHATKREIDTLQKGIHSALKFKQAFNEHHQCELEIFNLLKAMHGIQAGFEIQRGKRDQLFDKLNGLDEERKQLLTVIQNMDVYMSDEIWQTIREEYQIARQEICEIRKEEHVQIKKMLTRNADLLNTMNKGQSLWMDFFSRLGR